MTIDKSVIFDLVKYDFKEIKSQLSGTQRNRAGKSIKNYRSINDNLSLLETMQSDDLCNKKINQLTRGGAEEGFSANPKLLAERVELFLGIYIKAKERNDLKGFFTCFSNGDPCLSGQTESLYKYAASLENLDVDSMPDPEKSLFLPGTIFAEIIMGDFENGATEEEFSNYVKSNISKIAPHFNNQNTLRTADFLEYLQVIKIFDPSNKVNWDDLLLKLADSSFFKAVYEQSLRYVI